MNQIAQSKGRVKPAQNKELINPAPRKGMVNPVKHLGLAVTGAGMITLTFILEVFKSNLWLDILFCATGTSLLMVNAYLLGKLRVAPESKRPTYILEGLLASVGLAMAASVYFISYPQGVGGIVFLTGALLLVGASYLFGTHKRISAMENFNQGT